MVIEQHSDTQTLLKNLIVVPDAYAHFLILSTIESCGDLISDMAFEKRIGPVLTAKIVKLLEGYNRLLFQGKIKELYPIIKSFSMGLAKRSYADGLAFTFAETLNNFIGYSI